MARGKVNEPWASVLIERGFVDPRTNKPSLVALSTTAGVGPSTISRVLAHQIQPSPKTIEKIANALDVNDDQVRAWLAESVPAEVTAVDWKPPRAIAELAPEDFATLDAMIQQMAKNRIAARRKLTAV